MAIRRKGPQGGLVTTRIPVYTLSSVSTQAANKRLPSEAEALDNVIISMERAFEKRPGCELLPQYTIPTLTEWDFTNNNTRFDLFALTGLNPATSDLWAYWHTVSEIARYLIIVDFKATIHNGVGARNLFYVFHLLSDGTWMDETPAGQTTTNNIFTAVERAYITHGSTTKKAIDSLKAVSSGASIIILNTNVYAGFSSDTAGTLFNLDGTGSGSTDVAGREVTYFSSTRVDEQFKTDIVSTQYNDGYKRTNTTTFPFIPVQDFIHHIATTGTNDLYIYGQEFKDITEIRLPPQPVEVYANNENLNAATADNTARQMLNILYDPIHPYYLNDAGATGNGIDGRGKIYHFKNPYLEMSEGFYRVINFQKGKTYTPPGSTTGTPVTGYGGQYLQKIRTPYKHSYLDPRRMPMRITLSVDASGNSSNWLLSGIAWTPRLNGNNDTNPGPTVFKKTDGTLKQVQIKSIAVFKNRLWFSAEDAVFGSELNKFENFFLTDVTNIKDTDTIDIRASSNVYNEIVSLTPFRDFLFVNTKNNTQFQLMAGSANELTPTNVMMKPVSYYSTSGSIEPKLIGSQLFFYDAQRLYLFVGENSFGYATAVEVSATCAGYLPSSYSDGCSIFAKDTLAVVDGNNKNTIYLYTNKFSGDKFLQSSFYRFIVDLPNAPSKPQIISMQAYDDYLYLFLYNAFVGRYFISRIKFANELPKVPRLDYKIDLKLNTTHATNWNAQFSSTTGLTTFKVPKNYYTIDNLWIVLGDDWTVANGMPEEMSFTILKPFSVSQETNYTEIKVLGNYASNNKTITIGRAYRMNVQLSTLFVRDDSNNIVDGILNIRTGVFRHYNTGNYDISVSHNGRTPLVSTFNSQQVDLSLVQDPLPLEPYTNQGEFVAKIYGHSDTTTISIVSEYLTPCNITNMEFKGKFKQKYNSQN